MEPNDQTPSPFSLRLSFEERAQLERDAAGLSLSAYVRERIFDGSKTTPRRRGKFPVKDQKALASVLAMLGQSRLANNLNAPSSIRGKPCACKLTPKRGRNVCAKASADYGTGWASRGPRALILVANLKSVDGTCRMTSAAHARPNRDGHLNIAVETSKNHHQPVNGEARKARIANAGKF